MEIISKILMTILSIIFLKNLQSSEILSIFATKLV